ncbi:ABC-2 type transport system permease protein [Aquisalibacillus elongatus]|uniref:ABC-2 type transport system permease protein n=1 Tax=Aquisalibacillus elongatus TaxID=485577 RepID=A0A3N5CAX6_9BACI|nr:ABC transporter permease [Aquisalibacillus elongatus]RPF53951.1 ABC-2 type transport system permease protein [Aquisalibacillus elongatus]
MSKFLKLLYNELHKLYIRKSTWVMYIILAAIVIGGAVLMTIFDDNTVESEYSENWRAELQAENDEIEQSLQENNNEFMIDMNMSNVEKNNYHLDNDIKPLNYGGWQYTYENAGLSMLIGLFVIIVGAGIVASEFNWGTIKLLLIRPISRSMILFTKFAAVLTFALITLVFLFLLNLAVGGIFFGLEGANPHIVIQKADGFVHASLFGEIMTSYGYDMVNLVMLTALAFMISTIFRNSSLAIGIGIFLLMGGNIVVQALSQYDFSKYILFANTNLKQYETGNVFMEGMTLGFSVTVLIVYFVLFMVLSWAFFTKRDVAGQ